MIQYKAPLKDIQFLINDVFDFQKHYQQVPGGEEATPEMVDAILGEAARFSEEVISPLYQSGDKGCLFRDGEVTTPKGFREAYGQYVEGGWQGMSAPVEYGGQGLPLSLGVIKSEMIGTANWSWGMYPGLSLGAMNTIYMHGTEQQKQTYLVPLTEGRWTGTMCLTEPQCGTDLGQVKTKATANSDGSYNLSGTKIFISSGEHDLTEQIVHIVLARLPDAPEGTRGISLFIVPKFHVNDDGSLGDRNPVYCGSIEEKMGIHGSSTCVMNFDGARGFLIGPENKGLMCMFTFMNTARIGTSIQGIGAAELSFQGALPYARERRSMRSLSGTKHPDKTADALIVHPDVRRMLLTQKAIAEGGRAMLYHAARLADMMMAAHSRGDQHGYDAYDDKLGFLTPVLKAFLTELGYEAANHGVQVYGGHGFIKEWGMEQIIRDAQISKLYEGTTGVQALDLLGRKILLGKLKSFNEFRHEVNQFIKQHNNRSEMKPFIKQLKRYMLRWRIGTFRVAYKAARNRDMVGAASYDYLMQSGYVIMGYFWAQMADAAYTALKAGKGDADFYKTKIQTAEFYYDRMMPRARAHNKMMLKDPASLMQIAEEHFSL
ncbi:MAG: acyl-CoA dehydrogenase [Oceanospirillaceae bacterium]|uniref:acyl-CoA dehydrogenase C-terminal domain-containing protein n=1 Tax=unclassified Thalassolituus TaxID=2624967 RepID=UPI000C694E9D|nr:MULTISPECIES: acyl-CoA dehydrogenase C-terminal domain-containing protein [unclassified Thalassolituus]MAS25946.1 acyl-CoA dehydrogenase [Oceanospirillaceae bacterium]MAY01296.1 acyl-CoA dehydrogenase [Oceanospirillaceae bacterium]MBL35520.1 acyl-CoA dehydrogenase [Oceanospirillaceae bacterium]MBS53246.1 acyl-CoA dehydrogenase [Oceanospirillaceae bacterium]|tara:strand:+ start:435 stop:2240 length:1806 start_codon:yes stop_codon:yes gene_type:complete